MRREFLKIGGTCLVRIGRIIMIGSAVAPHQYVSHFIIFDALPQHFCPPIGHGNGLKTCFSEGDNFFMLFGYFRDNFKIRVEFLNKIIGRVGIIRAVL